ncbi:MAG: 2-aminoethylphosphonate--pyruvate transaminase [Planctomycetia bacterium]|nr:2-aminoethylphosphonate--pyruvate transaminase [Planctomycetia bacterium]
MDADIPYLLLTPGPLTTSRTVRQAMNQDLSTWDVDYNAIVESIRSQLVRLATTRTGYTSVLMPGSGTFSVESILGSVIPPDGKVLIVNNGAYGERMVHIAKRLKIAVTPIDQLETERADLARIDAALAADKAITHVAMVHCETTTGMLNPVAEVGQIVARHGRKYIVDAMSSFGGIPLTMEGLNAQFLVSSANKCVQGVPGFGFVIMPQTEIEATRGWARSLSLDLFDQWREMNEKGGKWRYTSPTHVVNAFAQALQELAAEGGVAARHARYSENHRRLVAGMQGLGFRCLLPSQWQSPIITSFLFPDDKRFSFNEFYDRLKRRRFVIYPGKVTNAETFRIGNIGHVFPEDMDLLVREIEAVIGEMGVRLKAEVGV